MAKGKGKQFKIPATLFNKDFWNKFGRVATNAYIGYIFDKTNPRMANGKSFPNYSTYGSKWVTMNVKKKFKKDAPKKGYSYKEAKQGDMLNRLNSGYANSKAPYVSGDLFRDTKHSVDAKNNAIYIGWDSEANKVKWLRDMQPERVLTSKAHPFPKKITGQKLMKLFNVELKKVMPKGTRTTTIGKKK